MTEIELSPTSDIKTSGIVITGGLAAWDTLQDNNNATYIKGITQNGYVRVNVGTSTLGALRIKRVKMRMKDAHDSAGGTYQSAWLRAYDPVAGGAVGQYTFTRNQTNVATQDGQWEPKGPLGKPWSQTLLNRIALELAFKTSADGATYLRVHEIRLVIDTNAQPIVTGAPVVSDFTLTTQPAVTWNYFDADNDPQSRAQVRVFSLAQYSISGFDPATSPNTWDSGELFGPVESLDAIGVDLMNGTTYRAYVRVAHDWEGADENNLGVWWSSWAVSNTFTVAVVPPPQTTITVTPDISLPSYRNRLSASLAGINMLQSQDTTLEDATLGINNWTPSTNAATTVRVTSPVKSGIGALRFQSVAAGTYTAIIGTAGQIRVKPGQQYTARASARAIVTARTARVEIVWIDGTGATISTTLGTAVATNTATFTDISVTANAPANAARATIALSVLGATAAAEQHVFDEMDLAAGANTFGWSPGYGSTGMIKFERAERLLPSHPFGPALNWVHEQVYSSGALFGTTEGFYPRNAVDSVIQRVLDRAPLEGPSTVTAGMIEWVIRTGTSSFLDIGAPDGVVVAGSDYPTMTPVVPGIDMTFSSWVWAATAVTVRIGVQFVDAANTDVGSVVNGTATALSTTVPAKLTIAGTPPATAVAAQIFLQNTSATASVSVFFTETRARPTSLSVCNADEPWPGLATDLLWTQVRGTYPIPTDGRNALDVYDHEAPPGRPLLYRVTIIGLDANGSTITGLPSVPVQTYLVPPARDILKDPNNPENALIVGIGRKWSQTRSAALKTYTPLGRDAVALGVADPIVRRDWLGGRDWSGYVCVSTDLDLFRLEELLRPGNVLLLQHHEGGQRFGIITDDVTSSRLTDDIFTVPVKMLECARPT